MSHLQCNEVQCNEVQCNEVQCNEIQCNVMKKIKYVVRVFWIIYITLGVTISFVNQGYLESVLNSFITDQIEINFLLYDEIRGVGQQRKQKGDRSGIRS